MARPGGAHLRFGCPRCMARLKARPSQAGKKQRCPNCNLQLVVPDAEQAAALGRRAEEYSLFEGDYRGQEDPVKAAETAAVAECPACHTRTYAPESQVGQEVTCPDCGTRVVVSLRPEASPKTEPPPGPAQVYALLDEFEEPTETAAPAGQTYIPVYCPVCNTLIHGTPDQVGRHLLCPDCYTPVLVPPPKEPVADKPVFAHPVDDEYALKEEVDQPPGGPPPEQPLIPVVCTLCETRLYATPDQVGQMITCPDCGTPLVVPRQKEPPPKPDIKTTPVGEYGVGEPVERAEYRPRVDVRLARIEPGDTRALERADTVGIVRVRPSPPRRPFLSGVFNFPWYPGTWPRLLGLGLGLTVVLLVIGYGLVLFQVPKGGPETAVSWVGAMALIALGGTALIIWGAVASAFLVAVVQDTAEGNDEIEHWPEGMFTDWAFDFLYLVNSLVVSLLPGVALFQLLSNMGLPAWPAVPAGVFFVFPVVLLSMLDAGSPLVPVSGPVWGSLFSTWRAWVIFYFQTAVLLAASFVLTGLIVNFVGQWGLILAGVVWVAVLMIYFRLVGRVAWCCMRRLEKAAEDEPDDSPPPPDRAPARPPASPQVKTEKPSPPPAPSPPQKPSRSILDDDFDLC